MGERKTRILLTGANGRMGRAVIEAAAASAEVEIAARYDREGCEFTDLAAVDRPCDALVDFSHPSALDDILSYISARGIPAVLCVTGYSDEQTGRIRLAAETARVFRSENMSLGVNLLRELVSRTAKVLCGWDAEIVEYHHNQKRDAPSGTAKTLFAAIEESAVSRPEPVYDRHAVRRERGEREVGLHSVRGGTIIGRHDVLFAGYRETITLSHAAESREVFAAGALRAAAFMTGVKAPGIYGMEDLFKDV